MLKNETEETRLFCHIFVIGDISMGVGGGGHTGITVATSMLPRMSFSCHVL